VKINTGEIFDIKKYAIHDGPGIRTTVFFKGCPLSCRWCQNPESLSQTTQRLYRPKRCIDCKECITACSNHAIIKSGNGLQWNAVDCVYCKTCEQVCPAEAVTFIGKSMSVEEVVAEITKDTVFYDESHGGVTISGGEPLMQPSFLLEFLDACGDLALHRTIDTCGYADTQTLLKAATRSELFLYDLKHMDPEKHFRYTGVSNEKILTNLKCLSRQGAGIIIRFPVIPGINSDEENVDRTGAFVSSLAGVSKVNILPFHCAAAAKYKNLNMQYNAADIERPERDTLESIVRRLENYDLQVKVGG